MNLWQKFRQSAWSPYAAGVLLGITCILAVVVGNHLVGVSGGIASITSTAVNAVAPTSNMYFNYIVPPGLNFEIMLVIGLVIGGFLAALSGKTFQLRWNDDPTWLKVFGASRWKRFIIGFLGAVVIQYGASMAGGCTSGLAISGGMLFAPSAFLFMGGMFAGGIAIALLVYRRRY